jgi:hypothetical protein
MNRYEVDCTKTGRFTVYVNEGALNKLLLVFMHVLSSQRQDYIARLAHGLFNCCADGAVLNLTLRLQCNKQQHF